MTLSHDPHQYPQTIVCIGDRLETVPQPGNAGDSWPRFLHALLMAGHPGHRFTFIDQCAPGQRLHHLRERWADDVLWYKPDTVVVMCGISDAYYGRQDHVDAMNPAAWGACLRRLIKRHRASLPDTRFVFLEPFLHSLGQIPEGAELQKYRPVLRAVCEETRTILVPLAEKMQQRIEAEGEWELGYSLEPNVEAQMIIADAALAALAPDAVRACPPIDDDLLLCIGDSITDVGRRQPNCAPLGFGYVRFASALWKARSGKTQRIRNEGIGGNTVVDLQGRWDRDVLAHKPKRLTIKIGINDVNRTLSGIREPVPSSLYLETLEGLLTRTREVRPDCRISLIQPFFLSRMDDPDSYRTRVLDNLKEYQAFAREVARKFDCPVLEAHEMFQRHMDAYHQNELSHEPVHINLMGHTILAEAFLQLLCEA